MWDRQVSIGCFKRVHDTSFPKSPKHVISRNMETGVSLKKVNFSNAKLEWMFSRMASVKTDRSNRLNRRNLDALLQLGEGPEIAPDVNDHHWSLITGLMIEYAGSLPNIIAT